MRLKTIFVTLIAASALIGLSACSSSDKASSTNFNKADVSFAQDMIPHHRQATEMAKLAASRTNNPDVLAVASKIIAAQQPEIDAMSGWLKSWGKKVPAETMNMPGMDSGSSDMPGMMSDSDMASLKKSSGGDFDTMFLTMMKSHHKGAIEMAKIEEEDGKYSHAVTLARKIQKDQAAEIAKMEALLQS